MVDGESGGDVGEAVEAAEEQACADEQNHGDGDFGDDESAAHAKGAASGDSAISLVEGGADVEGAHVNGGRESEENAGEDCEHGGEGEDSGVETDVGGGGDAGSGEAEKRTHG